MYHSIYFGKTQDPYRYNTYETFHLIPQSRPSVSPPSVQYTGLDVVPNHSIWFTGAFGSTVDKRSGDWQFYVDKDYPGYNWVDLYSDLMTKLQGQVFEIRLEDDPTHHYVGYIEVTSWDSEESRPSVTIHYECEPFRYGPLLEVLLTPNDQTKIIENPTSHVIPVILEITPTIALQDVTISGLTLNKATHTYENIVVKNPDYNTVITIDGYNKTIAFNKNQGSNLEIWGFPELQPGQNTVQIIGSGSNVKVKYYTPSL